MKDAFVLTTSFNINITRPVSKGVITATGTLKFKSRSLFVAESVLVDEKGVLTKQLLNLPAFSTPIYFLLNRPSPASLDMLRKNGTNIVGSITPNNRVAGKSLMQQLYKKFTNKTTTSAHILALLGDYATPASIMRTQGLMDFLTQTPQVTLTAKEVANWSEQEGFTKTLAYVQQAPEINIIWCANDAIAFGAKRALKQLNMQL